MIATSIRSYYNLTSVYLYPILKNPNRAIPTGSCVLKASLFIKMVLTNLSNQLSLNGEKYLDRQLCNLSIITEFFPPDYAATGQLIEELATQLEQQNIKIEVFTGQPNYAFSISKAETLEQRGNMRVQRSRSTQVWSRRIRGKTLNGVLFTVRAFLHIIKNIRRHDLFLLTSAPPFLQIAGYLANRLCFGKVSYLCLIYDLYPDIAVNLGVVAEDHWIVKIWQSINRQIWKQAKGIIVLSAGMKERVSSLCPEVADKISVIHSWSDPEAIVPMEKKDNWFAQKHDLVSKFTVLYSGNMGRCHDLGTIMETAKQLQSEPIQFVFIGGGPKLDSVVETVNQWQLTNCLFLPYQDKEVLPYSLTACDLSLVSVDVGLDSLVAPSKLYSALAAGRPVAVICSEQSYLRQLIAKGKCGISVNNGDSQGLTDFIRWLAHNPESAAEMGQASRHYLESCFTPKIIAEEYLQVLIKSLDRDKN